MSYYLRIDQKKEYYEVMRKNRPGFTLIEVIIVITILALLMIAGLIYVLPSLNRGRDARRKSDLLDIANRLEEYYSDHDSYPKDADMTSCGFTNAALNPYLKNVPCEQKTKTPYLYVADPANCGGTESDRCTGYRLLTVLQYPQDPDIVRLKCDGATGCHKVGSTIYTYGIAKGRAVAD